MATFSASTVGHTTCASGEDGPAGARASRWPAEVMTDLCARFERPDARNRWDKPLFTLHTGAELPGGGGTGAAGGGVTVESVLPSIATPSGTIVHGATEKRPREEVLAAAVAHVLGEAAPGGGGGSAAGASHGGLTQGLATIAQRPSSNANALADLATVLKADPNTRGEIYGLDTPISGMAVGDNGEELGRYIVLELELPRK